jgi:hypothetical protein
VKQLWLLEPIPARELGPAIPLDPRTRDELLALMAIAIETVHVNQAKGVAKDARLTANEDHRIPSQP